MALSVVTPPTMSELLKDPYFKRMMKRRPIIPNNLERPELPPMWHLWILTNDEKWKRGRYRTYDQVWIKFIEHLKNPETQDICITNIRFMMPPPIGYRWQWKKFPWCARCRRPSTFHYELDHRADPFSEIVLDEPYRCFYCGIRLIALPKHSPR